MTIYFARFVSLLLSAGLTVTALGADPSVPAVAPQSVSDAPADRDVLDHIVVLGASASSGFGVRFSADLPAGEPVVRPLNLAGVLEVVCPPRTRISSESTPFFFSSPLVAGERQITAALDDQPSLVVAIDFLFWYGYGEVEPAADEDDLTRRMRRLEKGLAQLERLGDVPIVLGDLPDMSDSVGRMLRASQMPELPSLKAMNERIHAWSADRANIRPFPLGRLIDQMRRGEALRVGSADWSADEARNTLQWDRLHPSVDGLIVMAQQAIVCLMADLAPPADDAESTAIESSGVVTETHLIRSLLRQRTIERAPKPSGTSAGS